MRRCWEGQGGRVIGVNFDGLRDAELKKSADGMGIRFTVLADDPAPRFKLPRSEALPVTYIVDARGKCVSVCWASRRPMAY